jgi:hypothetical protein
LALLRDRIRDEAVVRTVALWIAALSRNERQRALDSALAGARGLGAKALRLIAPSASYDYEPDDLANNSSLVARELGQSALRCAGAALPALLRSPAALAGGCALLAVGAGAAAVHHARSALARGIPQGSPISPLLANIYLHEFDCQMAEAGHALVRYADDFVICAGSQTRAINALNAAEAGLTSVGLSLNTAKTGIAAPADTVRFLGWEFDQYGAAPLPDRGWPESVRLAAANAQRRLATGASKAFCKRRAQAGTARSEEL